MSRGLEEPSAGFGECSEAADRFGVGVVRGSSLVDELFGAEREMELDLFFDFALPAVAPSERERERASNSGANHDASPSGREDLAAVRMPVTVPAYSTQFLVSARRCARPAAVIL